MEIVIFILRIGGVVRSEYFGLVIVTPVSVGLCLQVERIVLLICVLVPLEAQLGNFGLRF